MAHIFMKYITRNALYLLISSFLIFGAINCASDVPHPTKGTNALPGDTLNFSSPEKVGIDAEKLDEIKNILDKAVADSVFPGAVAAVVKDGYLIYNKAVGYHTYNKEIKMDTQAVFDLASVTKIMATTTAIMKLVDEGKISLDDKFSNYFPEFEADNKKDITLGDVLLHQAGFPASRPYVKTMHTKAEIVDAIKNEDMIYDLGTKYIYSDLGLILLGEIIEEVTQSNLNSYLRSTFYAPMNMPATYFNPHDVSTDYVAHVVPTENDTVYNRGVVLGYVHDEKAYFMGGIAGHAGLFSNTTDMARYATMILNEGHYGGKSYISAETINYFTAKQSELSGRGYGFDRRSETGFTSAGEFSSTNTFGHLGFTGTSIWMDKEKNMAVILLTNRVQPYRSYGSTIGTIRAAVADVAFSAYN